MASTNQPHPVVIASDFLEPPQAGPVNLAVETLRAGKSIDNLRVTMFSDERVVCASAVTTATLTSATPDVDHCKPIDLPPPDRCLRLESDTIPGQPLPILDHIELRLAPECVTVLRGGADGSFALRGWLRASDGAAPDLMMALAIIDAFPPVTYTLGRYGWAPAIHMTSYLRAVPAAGWLRAEKRGRLLTGGWIDDICTLRDSRGIVVAQAHQLVRMPRQ